MSVTETQEDLEEKIRLEAYYISEKKLSYNDLCWSLAEELIKNQGNESNSVDSIKKKGEAIFNQHYNYDELCWQIAKLTIISMIDESINLDSHKETKPQEFKEDIEEKLIEHVEELSEPESPHMMEHEKELGESQDLSSKQRLTCPKCGAFGHNLNSVDDKSKVLSYMGSRPIYRKKYACRKCGEEFT